MKRILTILMLMIYTLTSTGATVYYHQCGQNAKIAFSKENASHISCKLCVKKVELHQSTHDCHTENTCNIEMGCCKNVQIELKNSEEQLTSSTIIKDFSAFSPAEFIIYWIIINFTSPELSSIQMDLVSACSTSLSTTETFLVNCNFRI